MNTEYTKSINCKGKLMNLSSPKIMGILNLTPDSFFDGGKHNNQTQALKKTEEMLSHGADIIDIGGYSSRPGATDITIEEESSRTAPIIELICKNFPEAIISIDTFRSEVARTAINSGAAIINDISGGELDPNMYSTAKELNAPYILMHMRGTPQNMQQLNQYNDVLKDVTKYFSEKLNKLAEMGINDIILDPGFGFAKNIDQNYELFNQMELLNVLEKPLLVGVSRKSMIYKVTETSAQEALNGTTALNMLALEKGAKILRVHDVKEANEVRDIYLKLKEH